MFEEMLTEAKLQRAVEAAKSYYAVIGVEYASPIADDLPLCVEDKSDAISMLDAICTPVVKDHLRNPRAFWGIDVIHTKRGLVRRTRWEAEVTSDNYLRLTIGKREYS